MISEKENRQLSHGCMGYMGFLRHKIKRLFFSFNPRESYSSVVNERFDFGVLNSAKGILLAVVILAPMAAWSEDVKTSQLNFLPAETLFHNLIGDPREPQNSLIAQIDQTRFEGSIGKFIELLQWIPGDGSQWGWGIEGDSFIELDSLGDGVFPERVSDWYLGTYFSEKTGDLSHRLEYLHVSSHLGDSLFDQYTRFIYTCESFRYTMSYYPLADRVRVYGGLGYYPHMAPDDNRLFAHLGAEFYTAPGPFLFGTFSQGYFTYDLKIKGEAGGVANQQFELGLQWRGKVDSNPVIRMALMYFNGNSEYGQFYLMPDNHWSLGIFFDP